MTEPMTLKARMAAPIKAVRHALTDPGAVRTWFAEHAEIDLPHRYEFWGRYTPDGDAPHQRLVHADDDSLRFTWLLDGVETTTELSLYEESDDATIVTLTQTEFDMQEAFTESTIRGVLQTFWVLSLSNLSDYLAGRPITARVDFTSADLRAEVAIAASVEAVYESLTDSEQATAWFGFPIDIEPEVGGRFAMGGIENNPHAALIVDLEPNRRMSIDWGPNGIGTWELAGSEGETRLTVVQSGFRTERTPYAAWCGTLAGFGELRRYHEVPNWKPIMTMAA
jgi:uncharacterized protein YndB with AHSA1/START domain